MGTTQNWWTLPREREREGYGDAAGPLDKVKKKISSSKIQTPSSGFSMHSKENLFSIRCRAEGAENQPKSSPRDWLSGAVQCSACVYFSGIQHGCADSDSPSPKPSPVTLTSHPLKALDLKPDSAGHIPGNFDFLVPTSRGLGSRPESGPPGWRDGGRNIHLDPLSGGSGFNTTAWGGKRNHSWSGCVG